MNTFAALIKREILDGKNGYIRVPAILAGLTVALVMLSALGFGNMIDIHGLEAEGISNLGDALSQASHQEDAGRHLPAAITMAYWGMSVLAWMSLPFVIFFSLLGALYEERRDRSILFWKSMPVADWQEVLAKLLTSVVVAPVIFLGVAIAAQLVIALFLSIIVLFQGGPVLELWPLGLMIGSWFAMISHYLIWALWALPLLAWVLFVSAYASRLPFMWAMLTPVVLVAIEGMAMKTTRVLEWVGIHLGGWQEPIFNRFDHHIDGPRDVLEAIFGGVQWDALVYSLSSGQFWIGLAVAGGFIYGAIELRKRAI